MKKYALVVGIGKYRDADISDLPYAAKDAEGMGDCLAEDCEFDDVKILECRGGKGNVTSGDIARELARIADEIEPEDTFLFYFAGHGTRSKGQSRLLTSDAAFRMMDLSFSYEQLKSSLGKVDCIQKVLIFDCCRSDPQHSRGEGHVPATEGFVRDIATLAETDDGGASTTCVMFSCSEGQRAYEWPDKGHGVFTHFLIEGLSEKGWSGGQLTIRNVATYVEEGVAKWSKRRTQRQTPWSQQSGMLGREVVLAEKLGKDGGANTGEERAGTAAAMRATDKTIEELREKLEEARKEIDELKNEKPAKVSPDIGSSPFGTGLEEPLEQFSQASEAISQAEEAFDDLTRVQIRIGEEDSHENEAALEWARRQAEAARRQAEAEVAEAMDRAGEFRRQCSAMAEAGRDKKFGRRSIRHPGAEEPTWVESVMGWVILIIAFFIIRGCISSCS